MLRWATSWLCGRSAGTPALPFWTARRLPARPPIFRWLRRRGNCQASRGWRQEPGFRRGLALYSAHCEASRGGGRGRAESRRVDQGSDGFALRAVGLGDISTQEVRRGVRRPAQGSSRGRHAADDGAALGKSAAAPLRYAAGAGAREAAQWPRTTFAAGKDVGAQGPSVAGPGDRGCLAQAGRPGRLSCRGRG